MTLDNQLSLEDMRELGVAIIEVSPENWNRAYTITDTDGNLYSVDVYIVDEKEYEVYTLLKGIVHFD